MLGAGKMSRVPSSRGSSLKKAAMFLRKTSDQSSGLCYIQVSPVILGYGAHLGCNEPDPYVKARLNGVLPTPANPYLTTLASSKWFSPAETVKHKNPCKLSFAPLVFIKTAR